MALEFERVSHNPLSKLLSAGDDVSPCIGIRVGASSSRTVAVDAVFGARLATYTSGGTN